MHFSYIQDSGCTGLRVASANYRTEVAGILIARGAIVDWNIARSIENLSVHIKFFDSKINHSYFLIAFASQSLPLLLATNHKLISC